MPELGIGIEVQGIQHSEYTPRFHDSKDAFRAQQQRDLTKERLCTEAGILYVPLNYPDIMRSKDADSLLEFIIAEIGKAREVAREENGDDEDW